MASDKKDNSNGSSGADDAPGSSKRPSRVIDLEAEEVEIEIKPGEDDRDGEEDQDGGTGTDVSEETGDEVSPPLPEPPPQRTRPSEVKGFVTHLAAGLIGGLIGVVGAGIGLDKLPFTSLMGKSDAPEQIAQIEQRLNALDGKLTGQTKSLEGVAKTDALDKLETRLAVVEKKPEAAPAVPKDLNDRLAKLEDTLKTLISAAGEEGASGLEQSAALTAKIDAVSADFEKRTGVFDRDIAELKKTLQTREAEQGQDSGPAVSALGTRLDALAEKISELAARPSPAGQVSAGPEPGGAGAVLALAFESLRRAVDSGEAYTPQLDALAKLSPEGIDFSNLARHASTGAGTKRALLSALPPVLRDARAAAAKSDSDTFFGRLVSNAQSVVRVRRIGPVEGDSAGAVLARMEARMNALDLNGILREAKGLSGPALESVQPWLDKAMTRQESGAGLDALEKSLLASLKPGAKAKR
jgi:hypothetical protein